MGGALPGLGSVLVALSLTGCGIPIITFQSETKAEPAVTVPEPLVTGSIDKRPKSFGGEMSDEDWRRAHAALSVALDPQGNGRPVKWDNPDSSLRGSVNPTGLPYVANDLICRDFLASVIAPARSRFVRGTGCKPSGGEWELTRVRMAKSKA
ncbi:RT0821/Lpp0805 family surface protein [Methylobacterium marchantiae]|uniref:RT0821/Lpp0805 family surface protein n=1 Tax=Methylobacterium marchantiae TaxID=600331 RepID=A0ABW3WY41_9HYPH